MMYAFIRLWARIFLRLYFRKTIVYGLERVPPTGPLIVASNHPSAFLEASMLTSVMNRPIHFLVRGDMFNPKFKWLFKWTKQIPIYRQKDGISNLRKNASSFDLTYRKLSEGESVLIFPEAKTILEKKMRPIQRGTAHLAFGTLPYLKDGTKLMIIPVGVNFTEPRLPGTDVVVQFGIPFESQNASREDREAIEEFTNQLSESLSPLIIQVDDAMEKNYDVAASIYFRMVHENNPGADATKDLHRLASSFNHPHQDKNLIHQTEEIQKTLKHLKIKDAVYFPDLVVMNRVGLTMLVILKILWLIVGGWIWRVARNLIFSKIKTNTFQSPTTVGVFMVLMPLVSIILLVVFLLTGIPTYFVLIWLLLMWMGTLVRPSLGVITKLLFMDGKGKKHLSKTILEIRKSIEHSA